MWERFTERAKFSIAAAREEALRLGSEFVRTEHLLLGICRGRESIAVRVLENASVDIDALVAEVEHEVKRNETAASAEEMAFTPRAKKVLELAVDEAGQMYDSYLGTEHILLGLTRENESPAAQLLARSGVTYDIAKASVTLIRQSRKT